MAWRELSRHAFFIHSFIHSFKYSISHKFKKDSIMTRSYLLSRSVSRLSISSKHVDMAILSIAYLSACMSIASLSYFFISMIACAVLSCRLNGMDIYGSIYRMFCVYNERSLFDLWIDNMACLFVMLNIACSLIMFCVLPMSMIEHVATFIMLALNVIMFRSDMKM